MSRLSNANYLYQRKHLQADWFDQHGWAFSRLTPTEETDLHAYFAVTKDLTDQEALAHRKAVSVRDQSLPQRAGRAYARASVYVGHRPGPPAIGQMGSGRIVVHTLLRPEPGANQIIQALNRIRDDDDQTKVA